MLTPANDNWDNLSLEASRVPTEKIITDIHRIMNPWFVGKKWEAVNSNSQEIQMREIGRDDIIKIGIQLLNQNITASLEEIVWLFYDLLKQGLSNIHQELRVDSKQKYSPIESAAYLDNAFSLLEQERREQSPEYKLLLIWQEVIGESLWVPEEERSFESMARMLERLSNNKKRA